MSFHVVSWVLKHSPAELGTRLVLISLADHASPDGTNAWASVGTIQHEARLKSRRSVQGSLRELQAAKAICDRGRGPNGVTNYSVSMDLDGQDWGAAAVYRESLRGGAKVALVEGAEFAPDGGPTPHADGAQDLRGAKSARAHSGGAADAPKPSIGTVGATSSAEAEDVASRQERRTGTQQSEGDSAELDRLAPEIRPFVEPVRERLADVAAGKAGAIAPTTAAVARLLGRFPHKDFVPLADDFLHWALHGRGRGRQMKDVVASWRNWIAKEPDVLRKTPVPGTRQGAPRVSHTEQTRQRLAEAEL